MSFSSCCALRDAMPWPAPVVTARRRPYTAATAASPLLDRETARVGEGGKRPLDVLFARLPVRDGDADRTPAVPRRPADPCLAARLDRRDHRVGRLVVLEADEHLVQHDVVQELAAGKLGQPGGDVAGAGAEALDEVGNARSAERAQRRVDGEAARAA